MQGKLKTHGRLSSEKPDSFHTIRKVRTDLQFEILDRVFQADGVVSQDGVQGVRNLVVQLFFHPFHLSLHRGEGGNDVFHNLQLSKKVSRDRHPSLTQSWLVDVFAPFGHNVQNLEPEVKIPWSVLGMVTDEKTKIIFSQPQSLQRRDLRELNALLAKQFPYGVGEWTEYPHIWVFLLYRVSSESKKLVSCVSISLVPGDPMSLWNVATHAEEGRKGYGSSLIRHIQEWARGNRPFEPIWLMLEDDAPQWLHRFYYALGFRYSQKKVRGLWEGVKMVFHEPRKSLRLNRVTNYSDFGSGGSTCQIRSTGPRIIKN